MPSIKSVGVVAQTVKRKGEERELSIDMDKALQHPEVVRLIAQRFIDRGLQSDLEDRQAALENLENGILPTAGGGGARLSHRVQAARTILSSMLQNAGFRKQEAGQIVRSTETEGDAIQASLEALYTRKYNAEPSAQKAQELQAENAETIREWITEEEQRLNEAEQKAAGVSI